MISSRLGLVTLVLFAVAAIPATAQSFSYAVADGSTLSYTGRHITGSWTGTSAQVSGEVIMAGTSPESARIRISVPVESFDSGNSSRDSNMFDVVDAARHPRVTFESRQVRPGDDWRERNGVFEGTWIVDGNITFHGVSRPITVPVTVSMRPGAGLTARGSFDLSLTDHGVRRPRLLLTPIADAIVLRMELTLQPR
jgi:polyisoprenoid-binding protein YceI